MIFAFTVGGVLVFSIFVRPLILLVLLNYNVGDNDLSVESKFIDFNKPYSYSASAGNPYYTQLRIGDENFELKIKARYKRKIDSTNSIDDLKLGKLGWYYLK